LAPAFDASQHHPTIFELDSDGSAATVATDQRELTLGGLGDELLADGG
jgi:hypothetical protein